MRLFLAEVTLTIGLLLVVLGTGALLFIAADQPLQSTVAQSTPCAKGANQ